MSIRSKLARWVIPFPLGFLLTPVVAFSGTLGAMVLGGMAHCFYSFGVSCSDYFLISAVYGNIFAAPCTVLLVPLFYILGGRNIPLLIFAVICLILGLATAEAIEFVSRLANPNQLRLGGPDPLINAAVTGMFVFGLIYRPLMRLIESRLSPRLPAHGNGATS